MHNVRSVTAFRRNHFAAISQQRVHRLLVLYIAVLSPVLKVPKYLPPTFLSLSAFFPRFFMHAISFAFLPSNFLHPASAFDF